MALKSHQGYNIWRYVDKINVDNRKVEKRVLSIIDRLSSSKFKCKDVQLINFSEDVLKSSSITMKFNENGVVRNLAFIGLTIKHESCFVAWVRCFFQILAPIHAVDIIIDGKSLIDKSHI